MCRLSNTAFDGMHLTFGQVLPKESFFPIHVVCTKKKRGGEV